MPKITYTTSEVLELTSATLEENLKSHLMKMNICNENSKLEIEPIKSPKGTITKFEVTITNNNNNEHIEFKDPSFTPSNGLDFPENVD